MSYYLQHLASFILMLLLFIAVFLVVRFVVHRIDRLRLGKDFKDLHEKQERDRLDEERGRAERRKLREKESQ